MNEKIDIGEQGFVYPMPVTLVGADLDDRASFMTIAWLNRVQYTPPRIVAGLNRAHTTNGGIRAHGQFSVCFPDESMVAVTDWCGMKSSRDQDKAGQFTVFRGVLEHAPMIAECPLCLECRVHRIIDLGSHELVVADIAGTWTEQRYLADGKPDIEKMRPLLLTMPDNRYWRVGEEVAKAWSVGRSYEPRPGSAPTVR